MKEVINGLVDIELPFGGFYESFHDKAIDDAFEWHYQLGDWAYDSELSDEQQQKIADAIWSADVDWQSIRREYCKAYTDAFGQKFGLTLTFDELTSPREYNFATDRIFCKIPKEQIDSIRRKVEQHEKYPEYIKERFTSYDGFWSNYDSDYKHEDWTRDVLDECQYRVIIEFWLDNINPDANDDWELYLIDDIQVTEFESFNKQLEVVDQYIKDHNEGH